MHLVKVQGLQTLGNGSAGTRTNGAVIDFADRRHLGGCAGKECLVGDVNFVPGYALLVDAEAFVRGEIASRSCWATSAMIPTVRSLASGMSTARF